MGLGLYVIVFIAFVIVFTREVIAPASGAGLEQL